MTDMEPIAAVVERENGDFTVIVITVAIYVDQVLHLLPDAIIKICGTYGNLR